MATEPTSICMPVMKNVLSVLSKKDVALLTDTDKEKKEAAQKQTDAKTKTIHTQIEDLYWTSKNFNLQIFPNLPASVSMLR